MSDQKEPIDLNEASARSLKDAVAAVKNRLADQNDVVVDMKQAEQARLELLADDLLPLINSIDEADERFDFALSKGEKPRLWIDMSSFVSMGQDKRNFRFMKDTRAGRLVLAETNDRSRMADFVSEYIAERVVERERLLEGDWVSQRDRAALEAAGKSIEAEPDLKNNAEKQTATGAKKSRWGGFFWFMFGITCCLGALIGAAFLFAPDAF